MPRIAIAGFQHETNSFGTSMAGIDEFKIADSWPELLTGERVLSETRGMNLPIAGFISEAISDAADVVPILWTAAEPSGPVTDEAFETITGWILQGIRTAMPIDGIYLDLHGAMITESHCDGEGEILRRIREMVGPELPVVISLDLHANVSRQMIDLADDICIFKTYPHLDMADTGARAWQQLKRLHNGAPRRSVAFRQADYLVPLQAQHTGVDPARRLYAQLIMDETAHVELALGFTSGDTPDCGISVISYAEEKVRAEKLADDMIEQVQRAECEFDTSLLAPEAAVEIAKDSTSATPVILADIQDNPGAGASSDTTGLLFALVQAEARGVLLGLMHDPDLATQAHRAGEGQIIQGALGGKSGAENDKPFVGRFQVETLSDGQCIYSGEMYGGGIATLGPSCVLRVLDTDADVQIVVTSIRNQCLDLAQFTHFGLKPHQAKIIGVKSTAHFRAAFEPIASQVLLVAAPGLFSCRIEDNNYRFVREAVRR